MVATADTIHIEPKNVQSNYSKDPENKPKKRIFRPVPMLYTVYKSKPGKPFFHSRNKNVKQETRMSNDADSENSSIGSETSDIDPSTEESVLSECLGTGETDTFFNVVCE